MLKAPRSYIFYLIATKVTTCAEQQDKQEASLLCHQVCNTFIVDIAWFINSFHYNLKPIGDNENCLENLFPSTNKLIPCLLQMLYRSRNIKHIEHYSNPFCLVISKISFDQHNCAGAILKTQCNK